jgi:hypothetical protein
MIPSPTAEGSPAAAAAGETVRTEPLVTQAPRVKVARILDEEGGEFGLEYDDTRGQKNTMRLDALTYEGAIREARSFLGIQEDDHDEDGDLWAVE